jgi:hypothetical protein
MIQHLEYLVFGFFGAYSFGIEVDDYSLGKGISGKKEDTETINEQGFHKRNIQEIGRRGFPGFEPFDHPSFTKLLFRIKIPSEIS